MAIYVLDPQRPDLFPAVHLALQEPDGLLAVGGDLSERRLLAAYRQGIFPWYSEGDPILWWSPNPRAVLFPKQIKISRSLRKTLRRAPFEIRMDEALGDVIRACAQVRRRQEGTWINEDMDKAYSLLHEHGYAHSVEAWQNGQLVGGLYGVAIGRVFFGESMFSVLADSSKVCLVALAQFLDAHGFPVIDCQVYTPHLTSLGAIMMPRMKFVDLVREQCAASGLPGRWNSFSPLSPQPD